MKFFTVPLLQKLTTSMQNVDCGDRVIWARVEAYSCKIAGSDKRLARDLNTTLQRTIFQSLQQQANQQLFQSAIFPASSSNITPTSTADSATRSPTIRSSTYSPTLQGTSFVSSTLSPAINSFSIGASAVSPMLSAATTTNSPQSLSITPTNLSPGSSASVETCLGDLKDISTRQLFVSLMSTLKASFPLEDFSEVTPYSFKREITLHKVINDINSLFLDTIASSLQSAELKTEFWQAIEETIFFSNTTDCEIYSLEKEPGSGWDERDEDADADELDAFDRELFEKFEKANDKSTSETDPEQAAAPRKGFSFRTSSKISPSDKLGAKSHSRKISVEKQSSDPACDNPRRQKSIYRSSEKNKPFLWCQHYFFFNRRLKKMLFISAEAVSKMQIQYYEQKTGRSLSEEYDSPQEAQNIEISDDEEMDEEGLYPPQGRSADIESDSDVEITGMSHQQSQPRQKSIEYIDDEGFIHRVRPAPPSSGPSHHNPRSNRQSPYLTGLPGPMRIHRTSSSNHDDDDDVEVLDSNPSDYHDLNEGGSIVDSSLLDWN